MHPLFTQNLSQLSDEELHKKHGELLKRILQVNRLGYTEVIHQIQLMLSHFDTEIQRRNIEKLEKLRKDNDNFDQYINIG